MSFKMTLTIPKPNLKWYKSSKSNLLKAVEEYNKDAWSNEQDPVTENKWRPRAKPTGSWPILNKSGKMFAKTTFMANGDKPFDFRAKIGVKYGGFHQNGTSKMPQRRWLGLGSAFSDKATKAIKPHLFKGHTTFTAG